MVVRTYTDLYPVHLSSIPFLEIHLIYIATNNYVAIDGGEPHILGPQPAAVFAAEDAASNAITRPWFAICKPFTAVYVEITPKMMVAIVIVTAAPQKVKNALGSSQNRCFQVVAGDWKIE